MELRVTPALARDVHGRENWHLPQAPASGSLPEPRVRPEARAGRGPAAGPGQVPWVPVPLSVRPGCLIDIHFGHDSESRHWQLRLACQCHWRPRHHGHCFFWKAHLPTENTPNGAQMTQISPWTPREPARPLMVTVALSHGGIRVMETPTGLKDFRVMMIPRNRPRVHSGGPGGPGLPFF
jgi:hypothetical protein